jgi:hypothetical protein
VIGAIAGVERLEKTQGRANSLTEITGIPAESQPCLSSDRSDWCNLNLRAALDIELNYHRGQRDKAQDRAVKT